MARILKDLGERLLIGTIVSKYADGIGDDCAFVKVGDKTFVVTTDPAPAPVANILLGRQDFSHLGWMSVVINASDLAASGATPVGFLAAIEAPSDMSLADFERLLGGISRACREEGLSYAGGNLRERNELGVVGIGLGICDGKPIGRSGARAGDLVMSVGRGGVFWRDVFLLRASKGNVRREESPVFFPHSQIRAMSALHSKNLVRASIDNSDGLFPSLVQLSEANNLIIEIDLDCLPVTAGDAAVDIDPVRYWFGWGDWNVLVAVSSSDGKEVVDLAKKKGSEAWPIGRFMSIGKGVVMRRGDHVMDAPRLESERFAADSWFSVGLDEYIDNLLSVEIPF